MAKDPLQVLPHRGARAARGARRAACSSSSRAPGDRRLVARLLRLAHTLKGAARVVKQPAIAELAHAVGGRARPPTARRARRRCRASAIDALLRVRRRRSRAAVAALEPAPRRPRPRRAAPAAGSGRAASDFRSVRVDLRRDGRAPRVGARGRRAGHRAPPAARAARPRAASSPRALGDQLAPRRSGDRRRRRRARAAAARRELGGRSPTSRAASPPARTRRAASSPRCATPPTGCAWCPPRAVFGVARARGARRARTAPASTVAFEARAATCGVDAHVLVALRGRAAARRPQRGRARHRAAGGRGAAPASRRPGTVRLDGRAARRPRSSFTCRDDGRGIDVEAVRAAAVARGSSPAAARRARRPTRSRCCSCAAGSRRPGDGHRARPAAASASTWCATPPRGSRARSGIQQRAGRGHHGRARGAGVARRRSTALHRRGRRHARRRSRSTPSGARVRSTPAGSRAPPAARLDLARGAGAPLPAARARPRRAAPRPRSAARSWSASWSCGRRAPRWRSASTGSSARPTSSCGRCRRSSAADAGGRRRVARRRGQPAAGARSRGPRRRGASASRRARRRGRPARGAPILVVDDSLTTRMLEQSILESAGYEVELAVSAEEALEKAPARPLRPVHRRRRDAGHGRLRVRRAHARRPAPARDPGDPGHVARRRPRTAGAGARPARAPTS